MIRYIYTEGAKIFILYTYFTVHYFDTFCIIFHPKQLAKTIIFVCGPRFSRYVICWGFLRLPPLYGGRHPLILQEQDWETGLLCIKKGGGGALGPV